jgi:hypothetical protein
LSQYESGKVVAYSVLSRHQRESDKTHVHVTLADGQLIPCEVLHRSVGGLSLRTEVRLPVGEFVLIGQQVGRVARQDDDESDVDFVSSTKRVELGWTGARSRAR